MILTEPQCNYGTPSMEEALKVVIEEYDKTSLAIEDDDDLLLTRHTLCEINGVEIPLAAQHPLQDGEPIRGGRVMRLRSIRTRAELGHLLNDMNLTGTGAELGVFRGDYSRILLSTWKGSKLLLVDSWNFVDGYTHDRDVDFRMTEGNVAAFRDRVDFLRMTTQEAARTVADGSLDFVYIDAAHTYAMTRRDLATWYRKVKVGGIVSGHDYMNDVVSMHNWMVTTFSVKDVVDEFAGYRRLRVQSTVGGEEEAEAQKSPSWYFIKC